MWSIGLSTVAILISGLSVYWSHRAAVANREIERLRAERTKWQGSFTEQHRDPRLASPGDARW